MSTLISASARELACESIQELSAIRIAVIGTAANTTRGALLPASRRETVCRRWNTTPRTRQPPT